MFQIYLLCLKMTDYLLLFIKSGGKNWAIQVMDCNEQNLLVLVLFKCIPNPVWNY